MKTSSAKAKGRNLQDAVVELVRDKWRGTTWKTIEFDDKDVLPAIMGTSGRDVRFSPWLDKAIPWDIECKNQEKWHIQAWWRQTKKNTASKRLPMLIIKKNRHEALVVISLEDFNNKYGF